MEPVCNRCGTDTTEGFAIHDHLLNKTYCMECFEEFSKEDEKLPIENQ
jgi:hypothetical protein